MRGNDKHGKEQYKGKWQKWVKSRSEMAHPGHLNGGRLSAPMFYRKLKVSGDTHDVGQLLDSQRIDDDVNSMNPDFSSRLPCVPHSFCFRFSGPGFSSQATEEGAYLQFASRSLRTVLSCELVSFS